MKKSLAILVGGAMLAAAALTTPTPAEARGGRILGGILGGLATGALLGAVIAPHYYYDDGYYGPGPYYYYPAPVYYGPGCYWQHQRVWFRHRWHWQRVRVCD
jgi:hypothetical protein